MAHWASLRKPSKAKKTTFLHFCNYAIYIFRYLIRYLHTYVRIGLGDCVPGVQSGKNRTAERGSECFYSFPLEFSSVTISCQRKKQMASEIRSFPLSVSRKFLFFSEKWPRPGPQLRRKEREGVIPFCHLCLCSRRRSYAPT